MSSVCMNSQCYYSDILLRSNYRLTLEERGERVVAVDPVIQKLLLISQPRLASPCSASVICLFYASCCCCHPLVNRATIGSLSLNSSTVLTFCLGPRG